MLRGPFGCLCLCQMGQNVCPAEQNGRALVSASTQIAPKFESVLGQTGHREHPLLGWVAPLGAVLTHPDLFRVCFCVWVSRLEMPLGNESILPAYVEDAIQRSGMGAIDPFKAIC
jgi:hypothetical protein